MAGGDTLVYHPAALVESGDLVQYRGELYRCYEVDQDPHRRRVTLRLEACRHGDWNVAMTDMVPVERLT